MIIRTLQATDLDELRKIHQKHFAEEFSFPDFYNKFIGCFLVEDDGRIISAGGIRTIVEAVVITDKDVMIHQRYKALEKLNIAFNFGALFHGYDSFHAFIQDREWKNHLLTKGFTPIKGDGLFMECK